MNSTADIELKFISSIAAAVHERRDSLLLSSNNLNLLNASMTNLNNNNNNSFTNINNLN